MNLYVGARVLVHVPESGKTVPATVLGVNNMECVALLADDDGFRRQFDFEYISEEKEQMKLV